MFKHLSFDFGYLSYLVIELKLQFYPCQGLFGLSYMFDLLCIYVKVSLFFGNQRLF